jgi:hypothetical protein
MLILTPNIFALAEALPVIVLGGLGIILAGVICASLK